MLAVRVLQRSVLVCWLVISALRRPCGSDCSRDTLDCRSRNMASAVDWRSCSGCRRAECTRSTEASMPPFRPADFFEVETSFRLRLVWARVGGFRARPSGVRSLERRGFGFMRRVPNSGRGALCSTCGCSMSGVPGFLLDRLAVECGVPHFPVGAPGFLLGTPSYLCGLSLLPGRSGFLLRLPRLDRRHRTTLGPGLSSFVAPFLFLNRLSEAQA